MCRGLCRTSARRRRTNQLSLDDRAFHVEVGKRRRTTRLGASSTDEQRRVSMPLADCFCSAVVFDARRGLLIHVRAAGAARGMRSPRAPRHCRECRVGRRRRGRPRTSSSLTVGDEWASRPRSLLVDASLDHTSFVRRPPSWHYYSRPRHRLYS